MHVQESRQKVPFPNLQVHTIFLPAELRRKLSSFSAGIFACTTVARPMVEKGPSRQELKRERALLPYSPFNLFFFSLPSFVVATAVASDATASSATETALFGSPEFSSSSDVDLAAKKVSSAAPEMERGKRGENEPLFCTLSPALCGHFLPRISRLILHTLRINVYVAS